MADRAALNTNRELYREDTGHPAGSYYEHSCFVTEDGKIGINVGGSVITKTLEDWYAIGLGEIVNAPSDTEIREVMRDVECIPNPYGEGYMNLGEDVDAVIPAIRSLMGPLVRRITSLEAQLSSKQQHLERIVAERDAAEARVAETGPIVNPKADAIRQIQELQPTLRANMGSLNKARTEHPEMFPLLEWSTEGEDV
jgi:hypothetical protein